MLFPKGRSSRGNRGRPGRPGRPSRSRPWSSTGRSPIKAPIPRSPRLQLVDIQTTAKLEPIDGTDVKAAIRKQDGKGSMTIDNEAGRVVSTRMDLRIDIAVTGMGQSIEQSTETISSMTLLP